MRQVTLQGVPYTEIDINTSVLLNDAQLEYMYKKFHAAKESGFEGNFTDYITFCFSVGAGLHMINEAGYALMGELKWQNRN